MAFEVAKVSQDIEDILEAGDFAAFKTFIETSATHMLYLADRGQYKDLKAELVYQTRNVDWLKTKYSTEQEVAFLVGYFCGVLSSCEETLKKHFQEVAQQNNCDALNTLYVPGLKSLLNYAGLLNKS